MNLEYDLQFFVVSDLTVLMPRFIFLQEATKQGLLLSGIKSYVCL